MSISQKRDAGMDRLLGAALTTSRREAASACPEAALLAAFVEGDLTANEQSGLDAHIAHCGRCQEALAILAHDLPSPEDVEAAPRETGWFTWVTRPRLRWLVPISAAATVAVVVFATRPLIAPESEEVFPAEVARMAQAPVPPAEMPGAGAEASREKSAAVPEKDESAVPSLRQEAARPAGEMMAARVATEEKRTQPAIPEPPAPPPPARQTAAAPQAAIVAVADTVRKGAAGGKERPAEAASSPARLLRSVEPGLVTVPAPGGTVLWRFGSGGRLARSGDAGATWHEQASGVTADLLAGTAPSSSVCWIVGAAGTVLLTSDGEGWERRPFPETADLVAVAASSAASGAAIVTTRDGRRFETLDAGRSWFLRQ